jgi:cytochrome b6-f complex iron-sulfur subunit
MSQVNAGAAPACASCVSRRKFFTDSATIAALTALFAACGDSPVEPPTGKVDVKVADFPGLATMNKLVLVDNVRAAKRTGEVTFVAFSRLCTHEGMPVDIQGSGFICFNHGSQFDNNGQVTNGPATRALPTLATNYDSTTDVLTIG